MRKFLLLGVFFISTNLFAAGFLVFDDEGNAYRWGSSSPIDVRLDISDVGPIAKGGVNGADDLVDQALATWESAPGSVFSFQAPVNTSADVTEDNFSTFIDLTGTQCRTQDFLVVYDDTGNIFSEIIGRGSSILGVAEPTLFDDSTGEISCGYVILNGAAIPDNSASSIAQLEYTILHELGHLLNLAHTQINMPQFIDFDVNNDDEIPLMFPFIPTDPVAALAAGLKLDDEFSLISIYQPSLLNNEGKIEGRVIDKKRDGLLGVNVVCYDRDNPAVNVVSWISDANLDGQGEYICGHLPDGNYEVRIEPVEVAINSWGESIPPFVPLDHFNGDLESFDSERDDPNEKTAITIASASTAEDIDVVVNNTGRVISSETISGTVSGLSEAELEYTFYASDALGRATVRLNGTPISADIDLFGRCGSAFSLAVDTAGPFFDGSESSQADFAGTTNRGQETVVLDGDSNPPLQNCEYHLLIVNFDTLQVDYELTVTLEGRRPKFKINFEPQNTRQSNGETLVSKAVIEASDDQFIIKGLSVTDEGTLPLSGVTLASLYFDSNKNGSVDPDDTLLASTTEINSVARTLQFSDFSFFLDENDRQFFLVTYQLPVSSSFFGSWIGFVLIVAFMGLSRRIRHSKIVALLLLTILFSRCSSGTFDFDPKTLKSFDLDVEAESFGGDFSVQIGTPDSVKQFFE